MKQKIYDVVVIGAGSGGLTAAVGFSKVGKSVLLIEAEHMGGECTNTGCVPSKALLHHAKTYYQAKELAGHSEKTERYRTEAFTYVRGIIDDILAEETPEVFEQMGIDVIMGEASFVTPHSVEVHGNEFTFTHAIIATGSSPRPLAVPGLSETSLLTNQNIFKLKSIPERLLIIGAGPIGLELGQAMAMLGSTVTIADINDRLARLEDPAITPILAEQFTALGITFLPNAHLNRVEGERAWFDIKKERQGEVTDHEQVHFDKLLLAIGRIPNLPLGLSEAGVTATERGITVNKNYQTTNKKIYALGDVATKLKFTHVADDSARQVVTRVVSKGWLGVKSKPVPKVTYTEPEIAAVGLSWQQAKEEYDESDLIRIEVPFSTSDRAKTEETTAGVLVVVAKRLSGRVLGANLIGPRAGEIIGIFTLAISEKISLWRLRSLIYAYPTYSLVIKKAGDYFFATQIASLRSDMIRVTKRLAPKLIAFTFWVSLLIWFQAYCAEHNLTYTELVIRIVQFVQDAPYLYILLYAIRPLIFFPATILTALSGALYGPLWGVIYTVLGENASANFAYWIGRFFGQDLKLEKSVIGSWVTALREKPFISVLFMRLFYVPFDLTNYGSGVLGVPWRAYFLATLIGIMPGLTVFVLLGSSLDVDTLISDGITFDAFNPGFLALSIGIFVGSLLLSRVLKNYQKK